MEAALRCKGASVVWADLMRVPTLPLLLLLVALSSLRVAAQTPDAEPTFGLPTVTFEMDWRSDAPHWYSISIDSTGRMAYQSEPAIYPGETPGDFFLMKFTSSQATRDEIFRLARELEYFKQGNYELTSDSSSATTMTLRWQDALPREYGFMSSEQDKQATYNHSNDARVNKLTSIFERISATMEAGRRLSDSLPSNSAGIDDALARIDDMQRNNQLLELQALQPILQSVADNQVVAASARARARRLLSEAEAVAAE